MNIAAQMYTLREYTKNPRDIARTLKKVSGLGYRTVQLSGLGPIDTRELKKILDGEGLKASSTHTPFARIKDEPGAVVEEHGILDCQYLAVPGMPEEFRGSAQGCKTFAVQMVEAAQNIRENGIDVSYHNHSYELEQYEGKTVLETLFDSMPAGTVNAEIDTYWIQHGGGDVAGWISRMKDRVPLVHLKDMAVARGEPIMAEVGEGNLNWEMILSACKSSGVVSYIVEQDYCQRDPFESLGISLRNLRQMLSQ